MEKGLWDDIEGSSAFELTDFAAAAEKFRRETKDAGLADSDFPSQEEDDPLERLLREEAALGAAEEDGDEGMPEWADAAELDKSTFGDEMVIHTPAPQPSAASESKRSLLLGALNLKGPTQAALSPPSTLQSALQQQQQAQAALETQRQQQLQQQQLQQQQQMQRIQQQFQTSTIVVDEWFYVDPNGVEQGPFDTQSMSAWSRAGYFSSDLPIKLRHWTTFAPLGGVFGSTDQAFKSIPAEPQRSSASIQQQRLAMEQQRLALEQQRQQQLLLQQQQAEAQRQQQLAQHQALEQQRLLQIQQQQQQQLLQQQQQAPWAKTPSPAAQSLAAIQQEATLLEAQRAATQVRANKKAPATLQFMFLTPFIHPSTQQPQSRTWASSSSFAQNQQDDERLRAANQGSASQLKSLLGVKSNYEQQQPPQSAEGKPGWGTFDSGAGGKSLKDIMKQEEQQLKSNPEAARPSPNSWAAKIGAASSPFATASPPLSQPVPKKAIQQIQAVGSATAAFKPLPSIRGMSPEMVEWCLNSMKKIIGVDFDGSGLLEVLVDLESPTDIREIISETLGSVPLSSQFATEFIKRRKV